MRKILPFIFLFSRAIAQNPGDNLFNAPIIHDVYLNFTQTGWWDSLLASHTTDREVIASIIVDGSSFDSVNVKTKGNSSFNNSSSKKSFRLDFNDFLTGQSIDGMDQINLNNNFKDPTMLREKICLDFMNANGVTAPRCSYARVYLNNSYWGLYNLVERIDKTFLDTHFGNNSGNLFKGDPNGDMRWINSTPSSYYSKYELKTNTVVNDWSDLVHYLDKINNSGAALEDSLPTVLDINPWLRAWAANILFANMDSYQGSGHNYYIYDEAGTDLFEYIAWDVNEAFGNFQNGLTLSSIKTLSVYYIPTPVNARPLETNMLAITNFKNQYLTVVCEMINGDFDTSKLFHVIDSLSNWIRTDVYADPNKFFPNPQFEQNLSSDVGNVPGLKDFLTQHIASVKAELAFWGCTLNGIDEELATISSVFPNPASDEIIFHNTNIAPVRFSLINQLGQTVWSQELSNGLTRIDIRTLPAGMYYLSGGTRVSQKILIAR